MNNENEKSELQTLVESQPSICPNALADFSNWIDDQLETLLEKNVEWQTTNSNRKYFGR